MVTKSGEGPGTTGTPGESGKPSASGTGVGGMRGHEFEKGGKAPEIEQVAGKVIGSPRETKLPKSSDTGAVAIPQTKALPPDIQYSALTTVKYYRQGGLNEEEAFQGIATSLLQIKDEEVTKDNLSPIVKGLGEVATLNFIDYLDRSAEGESGTPEGDRFSAASKIFKEITEGP